MVQWHLLVNQTIRSGGDLPATVALDDGFDHRQLPLIQARCEAAQNFAGALDAFTEFVELCTRILTGLVVEKKTLDKWL
jgi:hypothetical protein